MIKTIKCPKCYNITTIEGNSGEIKSITCQNCGLKGNFKFPKDMEISKIIKEKTERPLGITILAVLAIIGVIFSIFSLISIIIFLSFIGSFMPLSINLLFMSLVMLVPLVLYLLIGYGFWKGLSWSWFLAIILIIIGFIFLIVTVSFIFSMLSNNLPFSGSGSFFPSTIVSLVIYLVIYGIILFYLTRPHVKRYFEVGKPDEVISTLKKNKKIIAFLAGLFIIVALVILWGLVPTDEIKILSVSHTPENPQPGDKITITADITGGSPFLGLYASCKYSYYFGVPTGGGSSMMSHGGDNKYSFTLHSTHSEGSEIWYMINAGNEISESYTIQVGHVERSNISTLSITNVTQDPVNPTTETNSVVIVADIRSNVSISTVKIIYNRFFSSPGIWGSSSRGHYSSNDDSYSFNISLIRGITSLSLSEDTHYPKRSKFFYRIVAKDKLGNTAVSKTYSFTIN